MPLSSIQRRAITVALAATAGRGHLMGGAAMAERQLTDRPSEDGDLAFRDAEVAHELPAVRAALEAAGFTVEVVHVDTTFVRLSLSDVRGGRTVIELVHDPRDLDTTPTDLGLAITAEELVRTKMAALYGRSVPRDLDDLYRLAHRHNLDAALAAADADEREPMDRRFFAESIDETLRLPDAAYPFPEQAHRVRRFGRALQTRLLEGTSLDGTVAAAEIGTDEPPDTDP